MIRKWVLFWLFLLLRVWLCIKKCFKQRSVPYEMNELWWKSVQWLNVRLDTLFCVSSFYLHFNLLWWWPIFGLGVGVAFISIRLLFGRRYYVLRVRALECVSFDILTLRYDGRLAERGTAEQRRQRHHQNIRTTCKSVSCQHTHTQTHTRPQPVEVISIVWYGNQCCWCVSAFSRFVDIFERNHMHLSGNFDVIKNAFIVENISSGRFDATENQRSISIKKSKCWFFITHAFSVCPFSEYL